MDQRLLQPSVAKPCSVKWIQFLHCLKEKLLLFFSAFLNAAIQLSAVTEMAWENADIIPIAKSLRSK